MDEHTTGESAGGNECYQRDWEEDDKKMRINRIRGKEGSKWKTYCEVNPDLTFTFIVSRINTQAYH